MKKESPSFYSSRGRRCGREWEVQQFAEGDFQSLRQRGQHVQRGGIAGRFQPVNRGLGHVGYVGQRLLAPAPRLTQAAQVLAEGEQNGLIFHPGKLGPKYQPAEIICDYNFIFPPILRPLSRRLPFPPFPYLPVETTPAVPLAHRPYILACDEASAIQLDRAMWRVEEDFGACFPHLTYWDWRQAFHRVQPDILIIDDGAAVTHEGLRHVRRYLRAVHGPAQPAATDALAQLNCYLAEKLRFCTVVAQTLRQTLPQHLLTSDLEQLLDALAADDPRIEQVCAGVSWLPQPPVPPGKLADAAPRQEGAGAPAQSPTSPEPLDFSSGGSRMSQRSQQRSQQRSRLSSTVPSRL